MIKIGRPNDAARTGLLFDQTVEVIVRDALCHQLEDRLKEAKRRRTRLGI